MAIMIAAKQLAEKIAAGTQITILDVRWSHNGDGQQQFRTGHIDGAQWIDLDTELAAPAGAAGRHPLPPVAVFAAALRRCGVTADKQVVIIDDGTLLAAGRLWWMLTDAGHELVQVLDGGIAQWTQLGYPLVAGAPLRATPGTFEPQPGHRVHYDSDTIALGIHRLWDVRAAERFRGETEPLDPVAGHIPGARNLVGETIFDGQCLHSVQRLREIFTDIRTGDVIYCGSGITAARTIMALEVAGIAGTALFPGSWSAWITDPQRPIATAQPST